MWGRAAAIPAAIGLIPARRLTPNWRGWWTGRLLCTNSHKGWTDESEPITGIKPDQRRSTMEHPRIAMLSAARPMPEQNSQVLAVDLAVRIQVGGGDRVRVSPCLQQYVEVGAVHFTIAVQIGG